MPPDVNSILAKTEVRDKLGRNVRDLRISVIDNCNLRCTYCMPVEEFGERYRFMGQDELLSFAEITRLASLFVQLGVMKIRLTGGEPLLRKGLDELVRNLRGLDGVEDISLTTNGLLLAKQAKGLREAGLSRITVSLDSLDSAVFAKMSGRDVNVGAVLEGIEAARSAGFSGVKINAVLQKGVNDQGVLDLVEFAREHDCIVRFIEYMDVGNRNGWRLEHVAPSHEVIEKIHARYPVRPVKKQYRSEVASRYAFEDGAGEIGVISSVTEPFCQNCARARLSADGRLYTCLFASEGANLRDPLRAGESDEELLERIVSVWSNREDRYSELRSKGANPERDQPKVEMYQIGG